MLSPPNSQTFGVLLLQNSTLIPAPQTPKPSPLALLQHLCHLHLLNLYHHHHLRTNYDVHHYFSLETHHLFLTKGGEEEI